MEKHTGASVGAAAAAPADPLVDVEAYVRASQCKHQRLAFLLSGDLVAAEDPLQAAYARLYPRWDKVRTGCWNVDLSVTVGPC